MLLTNWLLERQALESKYNDMHPHTELLKEAIDCIQQHGDKEE